MNHFNIFSHLVILLLPSSLYAAILGAYIFHRHGDSTPRFLAPTSLTALGHRRLLDSASYYKSRYLRSSPDVTGTYIAGIGERILNSQQVSVTAPSEPILQNSAVVFSQGLYPPVSPNNAIKFSQKQQKYSSSSVINPSTFFSAMAIPMPGYQFQLIDKPFIQTSGTTDPSYTIKGGSICNSAVKSFNRYFQSEDFRKRKLQTTALFNAISPIVTDSIDRSNVTLQNAYLIWDLINFAQTHNRTLKHSEVLTASNINELRTQAIANEWALSYDRNDNILAIGGMELAGNVLHALEETLSATSSNSRETNHLLHVEFGNFQTFLSFFGLANISALTPATVGIPDSVSSMVFELVSLNDTLGEPAVQSPDFHPVEDSSAVRFLFTNGVASSQNPPRTYPLFGENRDTIPWKEFRDKMRQFSIDNQAMWCRACDSHNGNPCKYVDQSTAGNKFGARIKKRMSPVKSALIASFVTFGALALFTGLIFLLGGFRCIKSRNSIFRRRRKQPLSIKHMGNIDPNPKF